MARLSPRTAPLLRVDDQNQKRQQSMHDTQRMDGLDSIIRTCSCATRDSRISSRNYLSFLVSTTHYSYILIHLIVVHKQGSDVVSLSEQLIDF